MLNNSKVHAINDDELSQVTGGNAVPMKAKVRTCSTCLGKCKINGVICSECNGKGVVEK